MKETRIPGWQNGAALAAWLQAGLSDGTMGMAAGIRFAIEQVDPALADVPAPGAVSLADDHCTLARAGLAGAAARRQREFVTGRRLAKSAMAAAGLPVRAVERTSAGAPVWPPGCVGSITHSRGRVAAAVAADSGLCGLGIDLEAADRVHARLHARLFTPNEAGRGGAGGGTAGTMPLVEAALRFSAKESIYKAVNPVIGRYIGFLEAEIVFTSPVPETVTPGAQGTFVARHVGDWPAHTLMETGLGRYWCLEDHVLTLFLLPR